MSHEIKPELSLPTFGGKVIAPAAPTLAEQKLREEFSLLHSAFEQMEKALHNKIDVKEAKLLEEIERTLTKAHATHERLEVLEAHWFVRLNTWFRGLTWL